MLDVANTLGLSQATIRVIERRVQTDKFIVCGGIMLVFVFLLLILHYSGKLVLWGQ
jgi:small neutral amino acid transporter SnatA (MarC family)